MCNQKKLAKVQQLVGDATQFVSVTFIKKDKTERTIVFNKRVKKGLKGESASESAKKAVETSKSRYPNHIRVCDSALAAKGVPVEQCWRMINSDTITRIDADGVVSVFK